jgi:hypothetical protein
VTPKQSKKLNELEDKLLDVFLEEGDPDTWPVVRPEESSDKRQAARGDRHWCAKNANQTMALLTRIVAYRLKLGEAASTTSTNADDDSKHWADMAAAEKKVKQRLSLVRSRAA